MLRVFQRSFSRISQLYADSVAKQIIKEDACQLNVIRYLDRFQHVMEGYHRGSIPNFEIIKAISGKQISCGIYDNEQEAKIDLLYFGENNNDASEFYIKPYFEPTTLSNSVQKRKVVTTTMNQFPRLPTEVSRYRTFSQFNHTWKQPSAPMESSERPVAPDDELTINNHITYKRFVKTEEAKSLPRRRGIPSETPRIPRGIYLHGDVGTGKSFLMDLFFSNCQVNGGKCRVHFHEFMQDFHRRLHDYKEQQIQENGRESHLALTSEKDAIVQVSKQIALSNVLICFDEFHVTDIADALILSHIFETFYKSGSVVFATSNHAPENLYMNGLNRMFFLPFISLITTHSRVIDISSSTDYRKSLAHPVDDVVLTPSGPAADSVLYGMFPQLQPGRAKSCDLPLSPTRSLHLPAATDGVCCVDYDSICESDRGADDYESIATAFHTVIIRNVPQFDVSKQNELTRFVKMIDQFYDHRVRIILTAEADVNHLFDKVFAKEKEIQQSLSSKQDLDLMQQGRLSAISAVVFSCKRTQSRLIEMTGRSYLEQHAKAHNTESCVG